MQAFKTFLTTFLSSVCIVFVCFGGLYWMITPSQQPAGTNQGNIPITRPTSADNKTTLVFLQKKDSSIFLLVKLNAVDGKVEINWIGTTIGSHTGPGTVALFFWGSKREK